MRGERCGVIVVGASWWSVGLAARGVGVYVCRDCDLTRRRLIQSVNLIGAATAGECRRRSRARNWLLRQGAHQRFSKRSVPKSRV